ncbi:hypothetical protein VNO78_14856 [Psophocarpus tetragonolobus]|uniref:Uncharacterized protein n=1 Tax=Psophocarpus tetragonolobus TaxID=3891 RepID=A0AAN9XJD6_PSOTE
MWACHLTQKKSFYLLAKEPQRFVRKGAACETRRLGMPTSCNVKEIPKIKLWSPEGDMHMLKALRMKMFVGISLGLVLVSRGRDFGGRGGSVFWVAKKRMLGIGPAVRQHFIMDVFDGSSGCREKEGKQDIFLYLKLM